MEEFKIQLTYNPDHFREIYYRNGQRNIFTYKPFRNVVLLPIVSALVTIIIYFLSYRFSKISWLIVVGLVIFFGTACYAIIAVIKYIKWKRAIEAYLQWLSGYQSCSVEATANSIEVALDSKTVIEKWENIKSVLIENDYILLRDAGKGFFIFPKKSMKTEEFNKLVETIKVRVK